MPADPSSNPPSDLRQQAHTPPPGAIPPDQDPTYTDANHPRPVRPLHTRHAGNAAHPLAAQAVRTGPAHVIGSAAPSPADLGFRMPAEFEPQTRVWVTTPTNPHTWPGCLEQAQQQHAHFCGQLSRVIPVKTTQSTGIAPEDAWVRDYGPLFLIDDEGNLAANQFTFNCWGEKYPPFDKMQAAGRFITDYVQHEQNEPLPTWQHAMVLEGGSISVNGQGTVLTTEACLLHPNRNPSLTQGVDVDQAKRQIEANLAATLNLTNVVWLPAGLEGDDTDGHVDDLAQFLDEHTLAYVAPPGTPDTSGAPDVNPVPTHPDHAALLANEQALQQATDQDGQPFTLVPLPVVDPPLYYPVADRVPEHQLPGAIGGGRVPASYANFLISNGHLFLPVFGRPTDDLAIAQLEAASKHLTRPLTIVPIPAEWLVVGLGALHCLTQQQPATQDVWVKKDEVESTPV